MSGYAEVTSAVFSKVDKLIRPLSDAEMKRIVSGESRIMILASGQQVVEASAALTAALKILGQLSAEELRLIEQRQAKLVLLSSSQQVVEKGAALTAALKAVGQLSAAELRDVEERRAKIAFLPKGAKIDLQFDPAEVASQLLKLPDVPEIVAFLDSDSRLGVPNLKKVAAVLSVVIPPAVKAKADIQLHIARSVVRDQGRSSAVR